MPKRRPVLKQFGELAPADFEALPVWASCHSFDYDEPWYADTDEETFRPWTGPLPADPADGMFLVRATFRTAGGHEFAGFVTPTVPEASPNLGLLQPHLAAAGRFFRFWGGLAGVSAEERAAFHALLGTAPEVFPIRFSCSAALASGICAGSIAGFYRSMSLDEHVIES
jgi:hypothetical protein